MELTVNTNRLRVFLSNDRHFQKTAATLYDMSADWKLSSDQRAAAWQGWYEVLSSNRKRIDQIRERGGLLHVGIEMED